MMLKACLRPLLRSKITTFPSGGVKNGAIFCKRQHTSRSVGHRTKHSLLSSVSGGGSLEDVLENWKKQKETRYNSTLHDSLTRCLYHCLKAAREQKLSSSQLMQVPHFHKFWQGLRGEVPCMSANSAVMCLYNCAQYDFSEDLALFSSLTDVCSQKVESIPSKAYGILLWSLCKLDLYQQNQPLAMHVAQCFHSELVSGRQVKPQSFANVLWALATTSTWPAFLTAGVSDYISKRAHDFDFHSLSIVLWSVMSAELSLSSDFFEAAGDRAALLLESQFRAISLIHCCWAFGSAAYYHQPFFSAVADKILSVPLDSSFFTPRLLSTVAWACARTGYYDSDLLDHIAQAALAKIHNFNSQDLGNLAYTYGYLNHSSDQLLLAISEKMSSQHEMAANELACANVANSCLIHKLYPEALLKKLMSHERVSALINNGAGKHLHVCVQMHHLVKAECPELEHCVLRPPHDVIVPALVVAESMVHCPRVYSVFHQNLCKALTQITGSTRSFTREALTTFASFIDAEVVLDCEGRPLAIPSLWGGWSQPRELLRTAYPVEDHPVFWKTISQFGSKGDGVLFESGALEEVCVASDWAARLGTTARPIARKVAFEADGPRHYAVNCRHKLGNTVIKHRLLKAQGWDVIAIEYFEWEELKTDQDHINYLAKKLYTEL